MKRLENVCGNNFIYLLFKLNFPDLDIKFGFKKVAKKNDFIRIEEIGDAFRHAGQNPTEDIVKDMVEKAKAIKKLGSIPASDDS